MFKPDGILQDEGDSDSIKEGRIIEEGVAQLPIWASISKFTTTDTISGP